MRTIVCLLTCCFVLIAGADDAVRTWTTTDGTTMQAQFVREVDGDVTFLKDGKLVIVPLDRLSERDQKAIRDLETNKKVDPTIPPAGTARGAGDSRTGRRCGATTWLAARARDDESRTRIPRVARHPGEADDR